MKSLYIMSEDMMQLVVDDVTKRRIAALLQEEPAFATYRQVKESPAILKDVKILFPSYGMECMDEEFLRAAENLEAVFFLGGSVKGITSQAFWDRKIPITCAAQANAVPVAEYVLALIILHLKGFFFHSINYKRNRDFKIYPVKGVFQKKVGLISYGLIARHLKSLLQNFNLEICIYSPELNESKAAAEGMKYLPLEQIFSECDVVSLHTPLLPSTVNMIGYEHFSAMKKGAAFINTARGAIVRESDLIRCLQEREDITAYLDVTQREPLDPESKLFTLKNAVITPHIAGATGEEKARLGCMIADELERYLKGEPLKYAVNQKDLSVIA